MTEEKEVMPVDMASVDPLPFERRDNASPEKRTQHAAALRVFRKLGLSNIGIRQLVHALRAERARDMILSTWPTVGVDRKTIEHALGLAVNLLAAINSASPRAQVEIATALLVNTEDVTNLERLLQLLASLVEGCGRRLASMPPQTRGGNHSNVVRVVANALEPIGISPTVSTGNFYNACCAAFCLSGVVIEKGKRAGLQPSPAASIRAFLKMT